MDILIFIKAKQWVVDGHPLPDLEACVIVLNEWVEREHSYSWKVSEILLFSIILLSIAAWA